MNGDKYFHSLWLSFSEQIWNVLSTIFFDNVNFVSYIHLPKTLSSVRVIIYKWHFGYWRWNILMPYHLLSAVPEKGQVRLIWNSKYLEIISTYMDQCRLFWEFEALAHYNISYYPSFLSRPPPPSTTTTTLNLFPIFLTLSWLI